MRVERQSSGERIDLTDALVLEFTSDARLFALPGEPALAAKIFHRPDMERTRKLEAMLANAPADAQAPFQPGSTAWPIDLLRATAGSREVTGYLLPRTDGLRPLSDLYASEARRRLCPQFTYSQVLHAAATLTAAVEALHARGHGIGAVDESHYLVSEQGWVTLAGTDSLFITDAGADAHYGAADGTPALTPPELQRRASGDGEWAREQDHFTLAVLLFQLLMDGVHPFAGLYLGAGKTPSLETRIAEGHFPYGRKRDTAYAPAPGAPDFEALHPTLRDLFVRCFEDGHRDPSRRPDARTWREALQSAERALVVCAIDSFHRYADHLSACPWCHRSAEQGGRSLLPARLDDPAVTGALPQLPETDFFRLARKPEPPPSHAGQGIAVPPPWAQARPAWQRPAWLAGWAAVTGLLLAFAVPTLQQRLHATQPASHAFLAATAPSSALSRPRPAPRSRRVARAAVPAKALSRPALARKRAPKRARRPVRLVFNPKQRREQRRSFPTGGGSWNRTRAPRTRIQDLAPGPSAPVAATSPLPVPIAEAPRPVESAPATVDAASFAGVQTRELARRQEAEAGFRRAQEQEQARRKQADSEFQQALRRERAERDRARTEFPRH